MPATPKTFYQDGSHFYDADTDTLLHVSEAFPDHDIASAMKARAAFLAAFPEYA